MRDDVLHAIFELAGVVFFVLACIRLSQLIWQMVIGSGFLLLLIIIVVVILILR